MHSCRVVVMAMLTIALAGCGTAAARQSVGATTATTRKKPVTTTTRARVTTTTRPQPPAYWAPNSFTADPINVAVGQSVTYSGSGCGPGSFVQVYAPGNPIAFAIVAADGTWSVSSVIPDDTTSAGPTKVDAHCAFGKVPLAYNPVVLNVSSSRNMVVQPGTSVHAGDTLTITTVGGCDQDRFLVALAPYKVTHMQDVDLTKSGDTFTGSFVVPPATPPGTFVLNGTCESYRIYGPAFNSVTITVLAADVALPQPAPPASGNANEIPITR